MVKQYKYYINKITSDPVVDFAAEELKKYLRMMMPNCGEILIKYAPDASDGFRLGLMQDFGLDVSEAQDLTLDDILHIDTDEQGGIIAGSNPRSVLLATYRYLKENGCRWLFSGVEGEYIPVHDAQPVKFHKMADCRYRGWCNEGAEFQQCMLDAIDIVPKLGMNTFMTEFENPKAYYNNYFDHLHNEANRPPEPVNAETTLQWKRQCEAEISKRGLQFHDVGHGWTANPFGIDSSEGWAARDESIIPEESRQYVAQLNGRRGFYKGSPLVTQFCMSNPEARAIVARSVADYAENHQNVDYLHVWLADFWNNQCECENCRKMNVPSDWYIMLMNDIDDELTRRALDTRIVFICYTEMIFVAQTVTINNPERFSMLMAPITRQYYDFVPFEPEKYERMVYEWNNLTFPKTADEYLMYGRDCLDRYKTKSLVYEYHFCYHQYYNPGNMRKGRQIHNDVRAYKHHGYDGIIQDGTQRNFFPNGFLLTVYAETLFDTNVKFEDIVEDYYSHTYGECWKTIVDFFEEIGEIVPHKYISGKDYVDKTISRIHNPAMVPKLEELKRRIEEFKPYVREHMNMPKRAQSVAMYLLSIYLDFWTGLIPSLALAAAGNRREGAIVFHDFFDEFLKTEPEIKAYCDHLNIACAFADTYFYGFRKDIPAPKTETAESDTTGGIPNTDTVGGIPT